MLTVSLLASKYVLDLLVDFEWPVAVYVFLLAVVGYGPSIAWWWFAIGRWGSGDRFGDVGATPRWTDLAWGPLIWLATILVQMFVGAIVLGFDIPLSNNTDDIGELSADRTYAVAIVIAAVIAAPLVEELVFRGLVMRSLLSKLPVVAAIVLQGVLFGVAHIDPVRGIGNIGLALDPLRRRHLARHGGVPAPSDRADGRGACDLQRRRDDPVADRYPRPAAGGESRISSRTGRRQSPNRSQLSISRTSPNQIAVAILTAPGDRSSASKLLISVSVRASKTVVYSRSAAARPPTTAAAAATTASGSAPADRGRTCGCERPRHTHRSVALRRGEAPVAARLGDTVGVAHDGVSDHVDAHVEIGGHLRDDRQLLEVLLSEDRRIGANRTEQLGDHGHDPFEVAGTHRPLHQIGERPGDHTGLEVVGVHRRGGRCVHGGDAGGRTGRHVVVDRTRVAVEVGGLVELQRVHEDRHHHVVASSGGVGDQCQMAVVERAHGRHEPDGPPARLPDPATRPASRRAT